MLLDQILDMEIDMIPKAFYDEVKMFSRIVVPISGGIDSTVIVVEFLKKGLESKGSPNHIMLFLYVHQLSKRFGENVKYLQK